MPAHATAAPWAADLRHASVVGTAGMDRPVPDASALYGLVGALRFPAHELQFGRAIHAICRSNESVARSLCELFLRTASATAGLAARRNAAGLLQRLPSEPVQSMSEQDLFGAPEGVLRQRARHHGRIDLQFAAGATWVLNVELKFNDLGVRDQQRAYTEAGRPVLFVVRNPDLPQFANPGLPRQYQHLYLGAIAWEMILDGLRGLPVEPRDRQVWSDLVAVSELNGDFARQRPRNHRTRADVEVLKQALPAIRRRFSAQLGKRLGQPGRRLAESLTQKGPYGGPTWADAGWWAPVDQDAAVLWIALRHSASAQPVFRVSSYNRNPRLLWARYEKLAHSSESFDLRNGWWTSQGSVPPPAWRHDQVAALVTAVARKTEAIVTSGVLDRLVRKSGTPPGRAR